MKKMLKIIIPGSLLLVFSCTGDGTSSDDVSSELQETWKLRTVEKFASDDCMSNSEYDYRVSTDGIFEITNESNCQDLSRFFSLSDSFDDNFCDIGNDDDDEEEESLSISMTLQLTATDSLPTEAGGTYLKTVYAESPNGLKYGASDIGAGSNDYSTYGRFYTYGNKMNTEQLAVIAAHPYDDDTDADGLNTGQWEDNLPSRVSDESGSGATVWQYESINGGLEMKHITGGECYVYTFTKALDFDLRGCTDESAKNYFGSEENDYMIAATKEDGSCYYTSDEAGQSCMKISHQDDNNDGEYTDSELVSFEGVIDCGGTCRYEGQLAWLGDEICDNGGSGFKCEAFNWDSWDCACASECQSDATLSALDGDTDNQVGQGNGGAGSGNYVTTNCQAACNVEDCGYDMGSVDTSTWDCCPEACLLSAGTAVACDDACNIGACDFYRNAATNTAADIGLCCDQTGPDATAGTADDIDCASLAGDGSCDEACNTGACNNDGGDCD